MSDLGTALRELARETEPIGVDAADLWQRGRARMRRRQLAGTSILAVVALLVVFAGATVPQRVTAMPAGAPHGPALPRNVYDPPAWLSGTGSKGPLGRLAVLGAATRHGHLELFGISATTGEYRFLDLHEATVIGASLSPDGRHVAYWDSEAPSGKPYPTEGQKVVAGPAVYDTESGASTTLGPFTEHGLGISETPIVWLDDTTILLNYGQKQSLTAVTGINTYTWTPPDPDTVTARTRLNRTGNFGVASRNRDGTFLVPHDGTWARYDRRLRKIDGEIPTPADSNFNAVSQSGGWRVAVGSTGGDDIDGLYVAGGDGTVSADWTRVSNLYAAKLLGWNSADTVLVTGWRRSPSGTTSLYEVDLTRAKVHRLGGAGDVESVAGVATDLLGKPMVAGHDPRGVDPRVVRLLTGGGVLAIAGLVVWLWRRRRAQG